MFLDDDPIMDYLRKVGLFPSQWLGVYLGGIWYIVCAKYLRN